MVSFLYGDKAILNIVPPAEDCVDTFDIPSAIRLAKLEVQHAAGSGSSISTSSSSITTTSNRSPDSRSNIITASSTSTSSNSMSQLMASASSQHAMQDSYLPWSRHAAALHSGPHSLEPGRQTAQDSAALLLPGSAALFAPDSGGILGAAPVPNSMVLPSGVDLGTCGLDIVPSTSGLQNLALSTGFLQGASTGLLQDVSTGLLQNISADFLQRASTGFLQDGTTAFLQDNMLPVSSCAWEALNRQACMISTDAAAAPTQLCGLQQQSVALVTASIPVPGPVCYPVLQPSSSLSMGQQPSLSTYGVPMPPGLVASSACHLDLMPTMHDLVEPRMPYAHALSTSGVVMGFPVGGAVEPVLSMQALQGYLPTQHVSSYTAAASVHRLPLSYNNGVSVEFAPPPPA